MLRRSMSSTPTRLEAQKSDTIHPTSSWMAREYRPGVGCWVSGVGGKIVALSSILHLDFRFSIPRFSSFNLHLSFILSFALVSFFVGCSHSTSQNERAN